MGLLPMPRVVWRILVDPRRVPPAHGGCVVQAIHHWNWVASAEVPVPSSVTVAPCGLVASQRSWVLATLTVGGAAAAGWSSKGVPAARPTTMMAARNPQHSLASRSCIETLTTHTPPSPPWPVCLLVGSSLSRPTIHTAPHPV